MDDDQLKEWILRQMGAPLVKVELTKEALCDAIEEAKRWFAAKKGVTRVCKLPVQDGNTEYCLENDVDTVLDVVFAVPPFDISLIFSPFILQDDKVPYDVFAAPSSAGLYSSFVQTLQYVQTAKRILGADADWRQEGRKLHIFPLPKNSSSILIEYKTSVFAINEVSERDHDLIKRFALAQAMMIVARIQSKYDSFPTAQGSATLNGLNLLDLARSDIEKLEEEISASGYPMMFFTA
jgi:hypothetical protein